MKRYTVTTDGAAVFNTEQGNELCRLTPGIGDEHTSEGDAAVAQILQAFDNFPALLSALTRLTEKVERACSLKPTKEDWEELVNITRDARVALSQATLKKYVVMMRSFVTFGTDTVTIDVHPGQDFHEVARRVAESYGAEVTHVTQAAL